MTGTLAGTAALVTGASSGIGEATARTLAVMSTSTVVTPGSEDTAATAWSRNMSFTGHAGVVSSIVNATRPPSMRRFLTNPSDTMSRFRSGSLTAVSAPSTAVSVTILTR